MEHGAHVGVSEEIQNAILAGFDIGFNFGKRGDEGKCVAVVRVLVLRNGQETLACQRRG